MEYEDLRRMEQYTQLFPNIETGGDLFGTWVSETCVFVNFAIGPGKGVRRNSVSFFQDANYLAQSGSILVRKGLSQVTRRESL